MSIILSRNYLLIFLSVVSILSYGQREARSKAFSHVEPPNWYVGMKHNEVQILFHNNKTDIAAYKPSVDYAGVELGEVVQVDNPHYLFVTLTIAPTAKPGRVPITFQAGKKTITYEYELLQKSSAPNRIQGFDASDVVYLIMPDRFANGELSNDSIAGMYEGSHRDKPEARHGGDLQGITNHLDYIKSLGVTAIWLNPVLENNQKKSSYHGYAITDLYNVDRRFGGNAAYLNFISKSHEMGLKVIQDMVMNHIGDDHWLMHDPPQKDWVHRFPEFTRSNYQGNVVSDPYASSFDKVRMNDGWFDTTMPDVNQDNQLFARYLIQNSLWWIEFAGLDGIRMDTQPYPDKEFMSRWCKEVMMEFPQFNIVGEVWINSIPTIAYWQKGMQTGDGYQSNLPTVTDFPFCFTVAQAFNEGPGWETGMRRLYTLLAQDFIYPNPNHNLTFLDNHDLTRAYRALGKDVKKLKMALAFMLTTRGIPQLYYGTELLMDGDGGYHPDVRKDFPGGWPSDSRNAFTAQGRTAEENDFFNYMQKLLQWRKGATVIHAGELTHYIPEDNVYVYFRHRGEERVMVVINANDAAKPISLDRFQEDIGTFTQGTDVVTGKQINLRELVVAPNSAVILPLKK